MALKGLICRKPTMSCLRLGDYEYVHLRQREQDWSVTAGAILMRGGEPCDRRGQTGGAQNHYYYNISSKALALVRPLSFFHPHRASPSDLPPIPDSTEHLDFPTQFIVVMPENVTRD